jgi:hypothetical protein
MIHSPEVTFVPPTEVLHSSKEVLARVVNQTIIKDPDFEVTNHVTIYQSPHPDYDPATSPAARRAIQAEFGPDALEETVNFLSDPNHRELTVMTRSMNASPLMHNEGNVWGIIKTGEDNKPIAIDVIGGCGPDETIQDILDREGFSEEAVMYHLTTGKFLLPLNGHDMTTTIDHLKHNALHHLRHNGFVPEPLTEVLERLIASSDENLIEPVAHNTKSPSIETWLNNNFVKATVILENINGETAEPIEGFFKPHEEGSDLVVSFHTPPPEELAVADFEWVENDQGKRFATERDYVFLPLEDWKRLALSQPVENATVISRGQMLKKTVDLELKPLAFSMFSPIYQKAV